MRRFLRMGAAVATLCWGGGALAQTDPVPIDPASWVTHDDYPAEALNANEDGTVMMTMDVDAAGAVTGCTITQSSGSASLDATSCRLMRERGRFTPATDARRRPVASTARRRINWQLPAVDAASTSRYVELSPFVMLVRLKLGEKGEIVACRTTGDGVKTARRDACLQKDGQYIGFTHMALSDFPPGMLMMSTRLDVEGMPFTPNPAADATTDIPPYFTQTDTMRVDATGKVLRCERRSSTGTQVEPCFDSGQDAPQPDQPARQASMTLSMAFQPAK